MDTLPPELRDSAHQLRRPSLLDTAKEDGRPRRRLSRLNSGLKETDGTVALNGREALSHLMSGRLSHRASDADGTGGCSMSSTLLSVHVFMLQIFLQKSSVGSAESRHLINTILVCPPCTVRLTPHIPSPTCATATAAFAPGPEIPTLNLSALGGMVKGAATVARALPLNSAREVEDEEGLVTARDVGLDMGTARTVATEDGLVGVVGLEG